MKLAKEAKLGLGIALVVGLIVATIAYLGLGVTGLAYRKHPNWLLLIFLIFCFVLPGILYWMAARREVAFSITATPVPEGCRLLYAGEERDDYREFRYWLRNAPKADPSILPSQPGEPVGEGGAPADIPTQIRQLAELRDAGAITEGEYEAKKRELLDRM